MQYSPEALANTPSVASLDSTLQMIEPSDIGGHRHDVTDNQLRLFTGVDELTGVRAFRRDKQFLLVRVASRVAKSNLCQRRARPGVVDDVRHDAFDVPVSFGKVRGSVLRFRLYACACGNGKPILYPYCNMI